MEYLTGRPDEPWGEVREVFPEEGAIAVRSGGGLKGEMGRWTWVLYIRRPQVGGLGVPWMRQQRTVWGCPPPHVSPGV